jgi:hypothetical protein
MRKRMAVAATAHNLRKLHRHRPTG